MDSMLTEAAQTCNVAKLHNLVAGNPFLFKPAEFTGGQNPLHIACMSGWSGRTSRAVFVKEVLYLFPGFANELNADGLTPLHIASGYGYLDIVTELVKVAPLVCMVKARDGKIPLHFAVIGGDIDVIDELLKACKSSIKEVTAQGETCLHIAVKYDKVKALQHLLNNQVTKLNRFSSYRFLNRKDSQGNSILHLAAFRNQSEVLNLLKVKLKLNMLNKRGETPRDVAVEGTSCRETLTTAGAKEAKDLGMLELIVRNRSYYREMLKTYMTSNETQGGMALVGIVLIAAATFQAVINPPGGLWQDSVVNNSTTYAHKAGGLWQDSVVNNSTTYAHKAGTPILATNHPYLFSMFLYFNSIGFAASIFSLMILVTHQNGLFKVALVSLAITYFIVIYLVSAWDIFCWHVVPAIASALAFCVIFMY